MRTGVSTTATTLTTTTLSIVVLIVAICIIALPSSVLQSQPSSSKTQTTTPTTTTKRMPNRSETPIVLPSSKAPGLLAAKESDVAVILTHPWGPLGGNMHNNVVVAASLYFQKLGITTLRFDFVGWQLSWGTYQAQQVEEAAQFLLSGNDNDNNDNSPPSPLQRRPTKILLVGYSYGSLLAASASANIPQVVGVVSIAPPWSVKHWLLLFHSDHHLRQAQSKENLPRLFVIGDHDNFTTEPVFLQTVDSFPKQCTTGAVLKNADHFFHRRETDVMNVISEWLVKTFPKCQGDLAKLASGDVYS